MAFFNKRKGKDSSKTNITNDIADKIPVKDIKFATSTIVPSYSHKFADSPMCLKWYFLVREIDGACYELFSGKKIEKESDAHHDGFVSKNFDTPYIEKLEPLFEYLSDPCEELIDKDLLFDFVLLMNVRQNLTDTEE